jgi:3-hydroxyisobutyrate dehydrogenase-like beta-hydroxyacid dehydrogenase
MGRNVFHVGDLGHGLAMKLINNMLGQIATIAIAEALVFGKKAGLDPKKIFEVVSVSTGNSVQFQNRVPRMLARNFAPGGTIDISYKDQELETGYAKALGVPLLMANLSQQVYQPKNPMTVLFGLTVTVAGSRSRYRRFTKRALKSWIFAEAG